MFLNPQFQVCRDIYVDNKCLYIDYCYSYITLKIIFVNDNNLWVCIYTKSIFIFILLLLSYLMLYIDIKIAFIIHLLTFQKENSNDVITDDSI